ncbi:HK97 family phage prohead protease [Muricoccus radiodurans]|uniref:HK97 family phage prohead protease n=1 Tax=Muricoccus radiodurans TaxID=2231721 RepID=UPI003CEDE5CD
MTTFIEGNVLSHEPETRRVVVMFTTSVAFDNASTSTLTEMDFAGCDLSLLCSGRAPLLADHRKDIGSILGVVETAWIDEGQAFALVRFASTPFASEAWSLVRDGILTCASMGFNYKEEAITVRHTDTHSIQTIGVWRPFEVTLCAVPANWGARIFADAPVSVVDDVRRTAAEQRRDQIRLTWKTHLDQEILKKATTLAPHLAAALGTDPARTAEAIREAVEAGG